MSNQGQKRKPVWRVNNGDGVPNDFGGFVIYENDGDVMDKRSHHYFCKDDYYFQLRRDSCNITHYQTNRTKAAKFERVECYVCDGDGFYLGENSRAKRPCKPCNGKGYTLERIK